MVDYRQLGLFQRYSPVRTDGAPLDAAERTFTLRYDKNSEWCQAARDSLRDFADRIDPLGYHQLATELRADLDRVEQAIASGQNRRPPSAE